MTQLNLHSSSNPPPNGSALPPVLEVISKAYKQWHQMLPHIPRLSRYTLGVKIDTQFIEVAQTILIAGFASRQQKLPLLQNASIKMDVLKWLVQTAWELKAIDNKQYASLAPSLISSGKMIGGWIKTFLQT